MFALLFLGTVSLWTGCATSRSSHYQFGTVTPHAISNSTVGYKGYSIAIPEGFSPLLIDELAGHAHPVSRAGVVRVIQLATNYLSRPIFDEAFCLANSNIAAVISASVWHLNELHGTPLCMIPEGTAMRILATEARRAFGDDPRLTTRVNVENRHPTSVTTGIFTTERKRPLAIMTCLILGDLNESYTLVVVGPPSEQAAVLKTGEILRKSLRF